MLKEESKDNFRNSGFRRAEEPKEIKKEEPEFGRPNLSFINKNLANKTHDINKPLNPPVI